MSWLSSWCGRKMRYSRGRFNKKCPELVINQFLYRMILTDEECSRMCDGMRKSNFTYCLNKEVYDWCRKTYGKRLIGWSNTTKKEKVVFYFKTKEDALAFKLAWS